MCFNISPYLSLNSLFCSFVFVMLWKRSWHSSERRHVSRKRQTGSQSKDSLWSLSKTQWVFSFSAWFLASVVSDPGFCMPESVEVGYWLLLGIRCDGEFPCNQCSNASLGCKREHVPKRRGPKRGSGRVINELRAQDGDEPKIKLQPQISTTSSHSSLSSGAPS